MAFDEDKLVTAGEDGSLAIWPRWTSQDNNMTIGEEIEDRDGEDFIMMQQQQQQHPDVNRRFIAHTKSLFTVAIDVGVAVSGSWREAKLWDLSTAQMIQSIIGHRGAVRTLTRHHYSQAHDHYSINDASRHIIGVRHQNMQWVTRADSIR